MKELAALLKAIAWPAVVLIVLFTLRKEVSSIATALAAKIERAKRVKVAKWLELTEEVVRGTITPASARTGEPQPEQTEQQEFEQLVHRYDHLAIANASDRVAERHRLADRLGQLAVSLDLPRRALAESGSEGKIAALATSVVLKPKPRDLLWLERAAEAASFNFTRYRIVLALLTILSRSGLSRDTLERMSAILSRVEYRDGQTTDSSLQRLIDRARDVIADLGPDA